MRPAMRILVCLLVAALGCSRAAPAAAQEPAVARVIAAGAIVRVNPAANAAVVATPAIGSLLEVSALQDEWVVILLPPNDAGLRRYGYILRQSVEVITDKSIVSRPDSLLRPPGADAPAPLAADWNDRYRNAAGRKRAGEAKKWSGRGIVGGGGALIALMTLKVLDQGADRNCTDADPCYEYAWGLGAGVGMMVAGGILSSRGSRQIAAANLDLIKLETERLNARPKTAARFRIRLGGAAGWETSVAIAAERVQAVIQLRW